MISSESFPLPPDDDLESKLEEYAIIEQQALLIEPKHKRHKKGWLSLRTKGYLTVFSGIVWMLFLGSHFMVGHLSSFVLSYFPDARKNQVHLLFPTITMVCIFSNFLGSYLIKGRLLHPQLMIMIASVVGIGGLFLSSFITNWSLFRVVFPLCYGFPVGFTNMIHLYLAWRYIPANEGLLAGIVNAGFGCGALTFTYLSINTINPDSIEARKIASNSQEKPYPLSVGNNFPIMLRLLCFYWTIIALVAIVTIQDLPKDPVQLQAIEINQVIQR